MLWRHISPAFRDLDAGSNVCTEGAVVTIDKVWSGGERMVPWVEWEVLWRERMCFLEAFF